MRYLLGIKTRRLCQDRNVIPRMIIIKSGCCKQKSFFKSRYLSRKKKNMGTKVGTKGEKKLDLLGKSREKGIEHR